MQYNEVILADEEQNRKRGMALSIVLHLLLLLLCFTTFFYQQEPPAEQISGIVIQLGVIEGGNNMEPAKSEDAPTQPQKEAPEKTTAPVDEKSKAKELTPQEEATKEKSPEATTESKTVQEESDIVAEKAKEKAEEAARKKKEAKEKKAAEEKAKKEAEEKAAAEAKRKAEEAEAKKKAEYEAKKSKFGSLLSGGSGNNNSSGNQGDPDGDPNSKALENLATGSGLIGEGLSDRAVEYKPEITDNSQKTGRIVVDICINAAGKVISSKYTQKGSTSADKELIEVAEKGVLKYRFSVSDATKQCGSVIIDFKLK